MSISELIKRVIGLLESSRSIALFLLSMSCMEQAIGANNKILAVAQSMFKERCASSGEYIKRTVDDVDGILLMKLRPDDLNFGDQYILDDPYGSDYTGEGYIRSFLKSSHDLPEVVDRIQNRKPSQREQIGYSFVEAVDVRDGKRYRYTAFIDQPGKRDPKFSLDKYTIVMKRDSPNSSQVRYGVTYEDISTTEDRKNWIAGSSLKVIDLVTNEVIAQRIGYMMDPAQGSKRGGRSPWAFAARNACPQFPGSHPELSQGGQANRFVEKVLRPGSRI